MEEKRTDDAFIIKQYQCLVHFLAAALGEDYEIVLHRIDGEECSVVEIINSHVTGRDKNSPITDLALKIIREKEYENKDFKSNYKGISNGKTLSSSTYFIKNSDRRLIGMLCINYDPTKAYELITDVTQRFAQIMRIPPSLLQSSNELNGDGDIENLSQSVSDVIKSTIKNALKKFSSPIDRLTFEEKLLIIEELNEHNIFMLKGSVPEVAAQLRTSIASVYRYLNKIKEE